jgi:hypothetical protein
MLAYNDGHPEPNIDVACVKIFGHVLDLPPGLNLVGTMAL